jgi:F0F1-type ATP synthase membrane subunit b/b'
MPNQLSLISIIIIILISLNLVLLLVYYFEYRRNQKLLGISKKANESERLYKRSQESANQLLNQTIAESEAIIDRAYREASNIVAQMHTTAEKIDQKIEAEMAKLVVEGKSNLQKQVDVFSQDFRSGLTKLGESQSEQVKRLQEQIYQETLTSLHGLIANLKTQALQIQSQAGSQAQEQVKLMQTEIQNYKNKQIEKINANLYDIILKSAKKVLGESLDITVKKETISQAIDDAKKDGLIS